MKLANWGHHVNDRDEVQHPSLMQLLLRLLQGSKNVLITIAPLNGVCPGPSSHGISDQGDDPLLGLLARDPLGGLDGGGDQ